MFQGQGVWLMLSILAEAAGEWTDGSGPVVIHFGFDSLRPVTTDTLLPAVPADF